MAIQGFLARQTGGLMRARTLQVSNGVAITNPTGAGNPVISLDGTYSGAFTVTRNALVATSTDGFVAQNTTAATGAVLVQMSPRLRLRGSAWNGSSSDFIDAFLELLPQSGTTRGQIKIGMERNAGSTFYPVTIDGNPTTALANLTIAGNGAFRSGGNGTASSPTFGWVNTGGGSAIGFYTPAANDMNLVCGSANQILWGVSLWRNSSVMPMCWSSNADPNLAVGDTAIIRKAAAKITFYNKPEGTPDAGFVLDFSTDAIAVFRNRADSAYATIDCLGLKASGVAGANFGPGAPASITVVNGIVTAAS